MARRPDGDRDRELGDIREPDLDDIEPREDPFGQGFDRPEPGRVLEHWHERQYTGPYDRWQPHDYVFYSGSGYHREFIEPYKIPGRGRYSGRGPKGYVRSDVLIEEDVHRALTEDPDLDARNIRVRVDGGEVTLEGGVPERSMKRRAEDLVYEIRGVLDVHSRLRVGSPGRPIAIEGSSAKGGRPTEFWPAEFGEIGGGSPPHYDRKAEQEE